MTPFLFNAGQNSAGGAVDIGDNVAYSLMLDSGSSQYLSRTQTTSGTWTLSCWVKRGKLSAAMGVLEGAGFLFNAGDTITAGALTTTAVYRDTAGWYHIHISNNGLYVNGVLLGAVTTGVLTNPDIGRNSTSYFDGYLADFIFLDNDTVAYTSFGRTSADTGAWVHKTYSGSYTAGSYRLDFSNSADLGNDVSGNNNDFTTNGGISSANQYTDTPTNNFAVWNPLRFYSTAGAPTLSNGNRTATQNSTTKSTASSLAIPNGQVTHAEFTLSTVNYCRIGIKRANDFNQYTGGWTYLAYAGIIRNTSDTGTQSGLATCTNGDRVTIEVDLVNNTIKFWKNGVAVGVAETIANADDWVFYFSQNSSGANDVIVANFGQKTFSDTGGSFSSNGLSTANLTAPAILDPSDHFFAKTRTGTGASYSVTGLNFQPDLVWVKGRSGATDHAIYDVVRGVQKQLESNTTTDETTETTGLTAFNSDGYTGGALAQMNTNTATYIDWMWKANGAGVSNTDGTITSTVSANQTAGISVGIYSGNNTIGATVGHGLGAKPQLLFVKCRGTAGENWAVYNETSGATKYMYLNSAAAEAVNSTFWNDTEPTSTVFSLKQNTVNNGSGAGRTYMFIAMRSIEGFSKFGSYTGNASADGPFVYCGFRPRWIVIKASTAATDWYLIDTARDTYNESLLEVNANLAAAEQSGTYYKGDITSNGFKLRIAGGETNASQTYIYGAFAELPFKYATAR